MIHRAMTLQTVRALPALVLALCLCPLQVLACVDWTARDESFWKSMYGKPRVFLFPLEPISLPASEGHLGRANEDGIRALMRGDYAEAERRFAEALSTSPSSAALLHNQALVAYKRLDLDGAAVLWRKAALLDPANPRYVYHLAFALSATGKVDEAIDRYRDLAARMGRQPELWDSLGKLYEFKGDPVRAEKSLRRALAADANYLPALNNLARLYRKTNRTKEAERVLLKLIRLQPKDADHWLDLGVLYADRGDTFRAVKYLKKAIALRPDYPELHLRLAQVYREMDRPAAAREEELLAHAVTCALRPNME